MTEIGATLREARMRAGIDVAEVEARTKIRAKYLRALENEEWSLLPGSTFVKSFLRTYAEALGLDGKLLVEEYKFRHEPYENGNGGPGVVPRHQAAGRRGRRRGGGAFGPPKRTNWLPILVLIVVVLGALFAVYSTSKNEDEPPVASPPATTDVDQARKAAAERQHRQRVRERKARAERRMVKLRIAADPDTTQVYVCVVDAAGHKVIDGKQLQPGKHTKLLRSKRFKIALNSDAVRITDAGKTLPVTAVDGVVAYAISKGQRTPLSPSQRPSCRT